MTNEQDVRAATLREAADEIAESFTESDETHWFDVREWLLLLAAALDTPREGE